MYQGSVCRLNLLSLPVIKRNINRCSIYHFSHRYGLCSFHNCLPGRSRYHHCGTLRESTLLGKSGNLNSVFCRTASRKCRHRESFRFFNFRICLCRTVFFRVLRFLCILLCFRLIPELFLLLRINPLQFRRRFFLFVRHIRLDSGLRLYPKWFWGAVLQVLLVIISFLQVTLQILRNSKFRFQAGFFRAHGP